MKGLYYWLFPGGIPCVEIAGQKVCPVRIPYIFSMYTMERRKHHDLFKASYHWKKCCPWQFRCGMSSEEKQQRQSFY
jgi:hypothetical protein